MCGASRCHSGRAFATSRPSLSKASLVILADIAQCVAVAPDSVCPAGRAAGSQDVNEAAISLFDMPRARLLSQVQPSDLRRTLALLMGAMASRM
jgi:hypothetical protein